jgi:hypothetical protein
MNAVGHPLSALSPYGRDCGRVGESVGQNANSNAQCDWPSRRSPRTRRRAGRIEYGSRDFQVVAEEGPLATAAALHHATADKRESRLAMRAMAGTCPHVKKYEWCPRMSYVENAWGRRVLVLAWVKLPDGSRLSIITSCVPVSHPGILTMARLWIIGTVLIQTGSLCPKCGYDVRHLVEMRCPECGRPFTAPELERALAGWRRAWIRAIMFPIVTLIVSGIGYSMLAHLVIRGWLPESPAVLHVLQKAPDRSLSVARTYLEHKQDARRARAADVVTVVWAWQRTEGVGAKAEALITTLKSMCLADPSARARRAAISALGEVSRSELCRLLPHLICDEDSTVRWFALASTAGGGDLVHPEATPYLIAALDDADAAVRSWVHKRLCDNTGQRFPFNPAAPRDERLRQQATWQRWWDALAP